MKQTEDIIAELDEIQDEIEGIEVNLSTVTHSVDEQDIDYFHDQLKDLQDLDQKIENLKEDILGGRDGRKHETED